MQRDAVATAQDMYRIDGVSALADHLQTVLFPVEPACGIEGETLGNAVYPCAFCLQSPCRSRLDTGRKTGDDVRLARLSPIK